MIVYIIVIIFFSKTDSTIDGEVTEYDEDEEPSVEDLSIFKYASIVSCDVGKSFFK